MSDMNAQTSTPVSLTDEIQAGASEAMNLISSIAPGKTLIDTIGPEAWNAWDASDEPALVADRDPLPL